MLLNQQDCVSYIDVCAISNRYKEVFQRDYENGYVLLMGIFLVIFDMHSWYLEIRP